MAEKFVRTQVYLPREIYNRLRQRGMLGRSNALRPVTLFLASTSLCRGASQANKE